MTNARNDEPSATANELSAAAGEAAGSSAAPADGAAAASKPGREQAGPHSHAHRDVVLLCNPQAGGRWRALADVLDSPEAKYVRRIVTDEIDDVRDALAGVGQRAKLVCIYGGDGTIYHVINELLRSHVQSGGEGTLPRLALLGGGTMNVTGRMYGMTGTPGENFRAVMHAYLTDRLRYVDVPVLAVTHKAPFPQPGIDQKGPITPLGSDGKPVDVTHYGFTFGLGPLVRILDRYERGGKGKLAAVGIGLRAIAATWSPLRTSFDEVLEEMSARVVVEPHTSSHPLPPTELPYSSYCAVFANTTGAINRSIEPFVGARPKGSFHFLAYAVPSRELATLVPMLARGRLPLDRGALRSPQGAWRALSSLATGLAGDADLDSGSGRPRGELPRDPRYVNHPARYLRVSTPEPIYTLDGEVLRCATPEVDDAGQPLPTELTVRLGPSLMLALREE